MTASVSTYLKLRLSSDLTADSIYNLQRIDRLGSVYGLTATGDIVVRASQSLSLEPNSSAVGGSGSGGTLNVGTSGHTLDAINLYGPALARSYLAAMARGVLRLYDTNSSNYIGLRAADAVSSDVTFTLPGADGSAGQFMYTDGAGALGWADVGATATALVSGYVDVGSASNVRTQVDTASVGDIAATTAGGLAIKPGVIVNADVHASAAIAYSKLALTGLVVNADIGASAAIALSKLAATTASRALVSDGSGFVSASAVTATELGYLAGLTSAAQTQLDARLLKAGGTLTGDLILAGDPDSALKAATKQYVDSVAAGLDPKPSVVCATTANISLSGEQTLDGVLTSASRVLVKNQSAPAENGIYVSAAGAWTRATDMNHWLEVPGSFVFVEQGTLYADSGWVCTSNSGGTIGSTTIAWSQFSGAGSFTTDGQGIEFTGTQLALELDGSTLSKGASGLKVADLGIANAQISGSAAIAYSKLNLATSIVNADISASAAIAGSKLVAATEAVAGAVTTAAQSFAGLKTFYDGIKLDDAAGQTTLSHYATDGATGVAFGGGGVGTGAVFSWQATRIGRIVTIHFTYTLGTTPSSSDGTATATIPSAFRPAAEVYAPFVVSDFTANTFWSVSVASSGNLTFTHRDFDSGARATWIAYGLPVIITYTV